MICLNLYKLITYIYFRRDPNDGSYLIDRTPAYFEPILNFLRTGSLIINPNLNAEGITIVAFKTMIIIAILVLKLLGVTFVAYFVYHIKVYMKKQNILGFMSCYLSLSRLLKSPTNCLMSVHYLDEMLLTQL